MMDEREAPDAAEIEALIKLFLDEWNDITLAKVWTKRILAAGYRLPTTGEIAAERRGWEQGRDAAAAECDDVAYENHWAFAPERHELVEVAAARIRALTPPDQMLTNLLSDAERRGWEAAADALDHWGDQEDAAAITCPEADVTVHREREAAFYDAAARLRAAPRASAALGGRDDG